MSDVSTRVKTIIADVLDKNISEMSPNAELINHLGANSIDVAEIVINLEREFNISIPNYESMGASTTVANVINEINIRI